MQVVAGERDALRFHLTEAESERNSLVAERDGLVAERDSLSAQLHAMAAERDALGARLSEFERQQDGPRAERGNFLGRLAMRQGAFISNAQR